MKILSINDVPYGSTGNIMINIAKTAEISLAADTLCLYGKWRKSISDTNTLKSFGNKYENIFSKIAHLLTGYHNIWSYFGTKDLIKKIDEFKPDIIHLHNLHHCVHNLPILFRYIKKNDIKVIWTLHDCWSFTGKCPYFDIANCNKWKIGCSNCHQVKAYPKSYVDRTKTMYRLKKKWFTGISDLTIVTPSQWLANLVKQSFLKEYPVEVINNGIDLTVFKPTENNFREKYNIPKDKFIVLGVAFGWGYRKGLDVFIELSKRLSDKYQIVLVGVDHKIDEQLPDNIISIHRTENQVELAEIYTAADIFANPTREDNFPTTNIESLACGTPVITFNTGGSPEIIDKSCGSVVDYNNTDEFEKEIIKVLAEKPYNFENCVKKAQKFNMYDKFKEYADLYGRKSN